MKATVYTQDWVSKKMGIPYAKVSPIELPVDENERDEKLMEIVGGYLAFFRHGDDLVVFNDEAIFENEMPTEWDWDSSVVLHGPVVRIEGGFICSH